MDMNCFSLCVYLFFHFSISSGWENLYHEWGVEIAKTGNNDFSKIAKEIAEKHDLEYVRSVSEEHMPEFFHFRVLKENINHPRVMTDALLKNPEVKWVEYQLPRMKVHRSVYNTINKILRKSYYKSGKCRCNYANQSVVLSNDVFTVMNRKWLNFSVLSSFNDYRWPCQWELYNCGQTLGPNGYDISVLPVWNKGITGKGMVLAIVDDGLEYRNKDLVKNYDPNASFDVVEYPDKDGPLPKKGFTHGTQCAGIVGMEANNKFCGVGVVHEAKVGGIRTGIGVGQTDVMEATALLYKANYIHVYSNSWGPSDAGSVYSKPQRITSIALRKGTKYGRNGKGNIYTFASGNGGDFNDHCGGDGYVCNIYTISIGLLASNKISVHGLVIPHTVDIPPPHLVYLAASSHTGKWVYYSEQCPCNMVTIPTKDVSNEAYTKTDRSRWYNPMVTTKGMNCTNKFGGTSSATPVASSVFLMTLQANPSLTWRDVQHLIAKTAVVVNPKDSLWQINGAGYHVHPYYGFGALNALRIVSAAEKWINVPNQKKCVVSSGVRTRFIPSKGSLILKVPTTACQDKKNQVLKLEHVQVIISYNVTCRGDITLKLTSPCGTESLLMHTRIPDKGTRLKLWPFMSVFHWGEDPRGTWTLEIVDKKGTAKCNRNASEIAAGVLTHCSFVFWGTRAHVRRNTSPPVCITKQEMKDQSFMAANKTDAVKKMVSAQIYTDFLQDFSPIRRKLASLKLQRPSVPSVPSNGMQQLKYEEGLLQKWKNSFTKVAKSQLLDDYIVNGKEPHSNLLSSEEFAVVRHYVADRLRSYSFSDEDIAKFMTESANILDDVEVDDEFLEMFADILD